MSRRPQKPAQRVPRGPGRSPEPAARSPGARRAGGAADVAALSGLFVVLSGVYALFFYRAPLIGDVARYQPLAYCLAPEGLLQQWCGAPDGEVAVWDRLPLAALAGAIGVTAFLVGRLVLSRRSVARCMDRLEYVAFATGIGFSGLSLWTLGVGLCGGLRRPVLLAAPPLLIAALSCWQAWRDRHGSGVARATARGGSSGRLSVGWWRPRAWWLAAPFLLVIAGGALLPAIHFDALEYHLQVPREWVQRGRIAYLPHNVYGNMPLGGEALVALAMACSPGALGWWWGALAGKLVLALFAPLAALLLASTGRRYVSAEAGTVAALVYLSTPWVVHVSISGLNEGVLAFYLLAAACAARSWLDHRHADPACARGYLWLAGWMAGAAAACKYTSVVLVVIPLLILVAIRSRRDGLRAAGSFALAAALACGPWYVKNWVQTGNPVYPLMARVFTSQPRTPEQVLQFQRAHQVPADAQGRRYTLSQAWQSLRELLGGSAWHSPLIVPLAVLVWLRRPALRQATFWLGGLLVFVTLWWLTTHRVDRFVVPVLPLAALVAGVGATWSRAPVWRAALWTVLACGLVANFTLAALPLLGDNRYLVRLEQLRDDPRLTTVSVAHRFLNEHVRPGGCVLIVGDAGVFNVRVPMLYSTCFDPCIFEQLMRGRDAAQRRAQLRERGVSHIYVDWAEIERYRQPGNYGFTDYVTPELLHGELEAEQRLIRAVPVPGLDPQRGEVFEVLD